MHPARLWKPLSHGKVQCQLCSHYCVIEPGARGKCGVRQNEQGALQTLAYDRVASIHLDPVEKKPLYHFHPGHKTFSLGTMGCNLECAFCQNYSLSQPPRQGLPVQGELATPEQLVAAARRAGAKSMSYTYSEPTVFFELVQDAATLAKEQGLLNILVSNGFMTPACLDALAELIQAANIDLKAFTDEFYKTVCGGRLDPVLENLKHIKRLGWWLEVTTLLIPGGNDADEELRQIAGFIANELGRDTPWHISRFHPTWRMTDRGPTPPQSLERAWTIGREAGLDYVYVGNMAGHAGNDTYCPGCGVLAVERRGFEILRMEPGACAACGRPLAGVGWPSQG